MTRTGNTKCSQGCGGAGLPPPLFLLVITHSFSMSVGLFLLCKQVHFSDFTCSMSLTYFPARMGVQLLSGAVWPSSDPTTLLPVALFCLLFSWLSNIPLHTRTTSLPIHLSMDIYIASTSCIL